MKLASLIIASVAALTLAAPLCAAEPGTKDPSINKRQHRQQQRIKQGVRSGELNKKEAKQLRKEERDIRQKERAYKSDGTLTKEERKDLQKDLNKASKDIHDQKHDAQRRK